MAMQMQAALLVSPVTRLANGSRMGTKMAFPSDFGSKRIGLRVKCMAGEGGEDEVKSASSTSPVKSASSTSPPQSTSTVSSSTPTPSPKKPSTSFTDLFAFSGPAPERINGRLAMIGFTAALAVELTKGTDLFTQISDGGAQWFLVTSIVLSVASLVPLLKGERAESKIEGLMNADAELWNGRAAMLGLVALAVTELATGSALV